MKSMVPLEEARVVIVGLARNCESVVASEIRRIDSAFAIFRNRSWIVVESDSNDRTVEEIESITDQIDLRLISKGRLSDRHPLRTDRLALCRNICLEEIESDPRLRGADFVAVADLDGINSSLTEESIRACWNVEVEWDACFANQESPYYDIWALRHEDWSPGDFLRGYEFRLAHGVRQQKAISDTYYGSMITLDPRTPPLEVESAFGGIGIYKKDFIEGCRYVGLDGDGREVCEHVEFHAGLRRKGAKLFIIPNFINGSWNEHSLEISPFRHFVRSLKSTVLAGLAVLRGLSRSFNRRG